MEKFNVMIDIERYAVAICMRLDEDYPDVGDFDLNKVKESISETIRYYEDTLGGIEDWEQFEADLYWDVRNKLGLV